MGKRVGAYIQELRQQHGLSIRKLGDEAGLSPSYVSLIERGEREVSIQNLYPIVQALGGDFGSAMRLLAIDAGIPEEAVSPPKAV